MVDKIITDRNILRQTSTEISYKDVEKMDLIKRLREANTTAWTEGCGLAAIQIGIPARFAWYLYDDREYTLLNPEIIETFGKQTLPEGCLSIPNKYTDVERPYEIVYRTNGKKKRARGKKARIIQHEIDHMNGILVDEKKKM